MITAFKLAIKNAIDQNLNNEAVKFYNGLEWITVSYEELKSASDEVCKHLKGCTSCTCSTMSYVLLYLKITKTFPILILGTLNADIGFVCVEEGKEKEFLIQYLSDLNVAYILSNIDCSKWNNILLTSIILKNKFVILGEELSLWCTQKFRRDQCSKLKNEFMYAIRTSGSTGLSKIVNVSYNSIIPNIKDLSKILQITHNDVIPLMTPITFDPSIVEILLALFNGCTLCILDKTVKENPYRIIDILFPSLGGIITVLQITPSILKEWLKISGLRNYIFHSTSSLRALLLGGEEFPSIEEFRSWKVSPHISVYNIYGITEVSCWASIKKVWPSNCLFNDIGKPLSETMLKIVDADENQQGELWIGSKTRVCLVGNENYGTSFRGGLPVWRPTGDIFKMWNGNFFFVGRKDDILKRWGVRLCLSEIEKKARLHDDITNCSCVSLKLAGDLTMVALFVVPRNDSFSVQNLQDYLKKNLPKTSWPDKIISLTTMPLTNHGKVCKESLRNLVAEREKEATRETFDKLWKQHTKQKTQEGIDFLSAGGDSFSALQFMNELQTSFGSLPNIFFRLLLERRSQDDLWQIVEKYHREGFKFEDSLKADKSNNELIHSSDPEEPSFSNEINIGKTFLRGRVSNFATEFQGSQLQLQESDSHQLNMEELFKYNLGKCVDASPLGIQYINKSSIVIVGSHSGNIVVLDVSNMDVISKCTLPDRIESSAAISLCGKSYYIGCYDGCLYSVSVQSGMVLWKYQTGDMVKSTPAIQQADVIFGSYDKYVYRLSKDGKLKWKCLLKSPILAEVIVDKENLYCATLGSIACLNLLGELLWENPHDPVFSTPVISEDHLVLANVKGEVQWFNKESGKQENSFKAGGMIFSSLVKHTIDNEEVIIFGCHDNCIYCVRNKKLLWKMAVDSKVVSTPFIEPSFSDLPKFLVVISTSGKVYLLKFENGEKICEYSLPGEVFSSPIVIDNKLIVGCRDDNVYFLQINSY